MKIVQFVGEIVSFLSALAALIGTTTGHHVGHVEIISWLAVLMVWIAIATLRRLEARSWRNQARGWAEQAEFWQHRVIR